MEKYIKLDDGYSLIFLNPSIVENTYQAIMDGKEHIHELMGNNWPDSSYCLNDCLLELESFEDDFNNNLAFCYGIYLDDKQYGCLYLMPSIVSDFDLVCTIFTIDSIMDKQVYENAKKYFSKLDVRIAYLGFDITSKELINMAEKK